MVRLGAATAPEPRRAGGPHVRILTPPRARRRCRRQRDRRCGGHLRALAQGQPPSGPTPPVLAGTELPSFRFRLGARHPQACDGGWSKEATVADFPVSREARRRLMPLAPGALRELHWHANAAEWAYVISGHCRVTTIDPQGHSRDRRFRRRRRLVLPARARPFDPGPRPRGLPVHPGLRQRLFLGVRHLQHHRLDRPHAARGAGEELRRAGLDLRQLPQEGGLHRQGAGAAAAAGRSGAGLAQRGAADAPLPAAGAAARELSRRHHAAGVAARIPDLDHHDRRAACASSRAACASCIGIPMPTSGSTTSTAAPA